MNAHDVLMSSLGHLSYSQPLLIECLTAPDKAFFRSSDHITSLPATLFKQEVTELASQNRVSCYPWTVVMSLCHASPVHIEPAQLWLQGQILYRYNPLGVMTED